MNTEIEIGSHKVKVVQEHQINETNLHAAIVTIRPSATRLQEPDIVMGVGDHPIKAQQDAFDRAKDLIKANSNK